MPEGEGVPEASTMGEPHEVEEFHEERAEADREPEDYPRERPRPIEPARPRPQGRDYDRRERGGRDRGGDRGGRRDDRYERERSLFRVLRGQVDRIRHTLESVVRDLERVTTTLSQAEQDQHLTEQELETLREQIEQLQRGGGRGHDRGRRHDD